MTALVWGVKASLLAYLAEQDATTTCTDGAEALPDGRFRWPAAPADDGFRARGTVRFEAYGGMLDLRLESPALVLTEGRARLTVAMQGGAVEIGSGAVAEHDGLLVATVAVTAAGSRLLGDVYPPGTPLDDLVVER